MHQTVQSVIRYIEHRNSSKMDSNSAIIYSGEIGDIVENLRHEKKKAETDSATNVKNGLRTCWWLLFINV